MGFFSLKPSTCIWLPGLCLTWIWTASLSQSQADKHKSDWKYFVSASQGYTHYDAKDLNRVLILMERTTQQNGFNNYQVNQFDGHPQNAMVVGAQKGRWRFGVEAEFWIEDFQQDDVPFDLGNAERLVRITCDDLRAPGFSPAQLAGCVQARERFEFLPLTAQFSYALLQKRRFALEAGYGLGVMAGSAYVEMHTDYIGEGAIPDDRIRFQVWPGINPLHKFFVDTEAKIWGPLSLVWRMGYRISELEGFSLRKQDGESRIFKTVFPLAREGANLYIQSFDPPRDETDQLF